MSLTGSDDVRHSQHALTLRAHTLLPVVGIFACIDPVAVDIYGLCELVYGC